jgi:Spy/CpxP family protein refolding chaperone
LKTTRKQSKAFLAAIAAVATLAAFAAIAPDTRFGASWGGEDADEGGDGSSGDEGQGLRSVLVMMRENDHPANAQTGNNAKCNNDHPND